jgi:hypothetical protein
VAHPSFKIYIDESGDEGFAFKAPRLGSSHWFVLSAVITRWEIDLETVKLVDEVRQLLKKQPRQPLHFQRLKHEHRLPYVEKISLARLRTVSVLVHKLSLKEPDTFRGRFVLYYYTARYLLERISWFCRDHRLANDAGDGSADIVFSNRGGMSYEELREYLRKLKARTELGDVSIEWSVIRPEQIQAMNHEKLMGLQIADAVASSLYFAVQQTPLGFTEPRYAQMLKPVVYHHSGQHLGYGIKFWPRETAELLDNEKTLQWVKQTFQ